MKSDEKIRQMIDEWVSAVKDKDVDRLMTQYAPDVVVYDVPAPLQQKGADAHRENFEKWFSSMPGRTTSAIRDLRIVAGETIAFAHCLNHISSESAGRPADDGQLGPRHGVLREARRRMEGHARAHLDAHR